MVEYNNELEFGEANNKPQLFPDSDDDESVLQSRILKDIDKDDDNSRQFQISPRGRQETLVFGDPLQELDLEKSYQNQQRVDQQLSQQIEEEVLQELRGNNDDSFDEVQRIDGGASVYSSGSNTVMRRGTQDQNLESSQNETVMLRGLGGDEDMQRSRQGTQMQRVDTSVDSSQFLRLDTDEDTTIKKVGGPEESNGNIDTSQSMKFFNNMQGLQQQEPPYQQYQQQNQIVYQENQLDNPYQQLDNPYQNQQQQYQYQQQQYYQQQQQQQQYAPNDQNHTLYSTSQNYEEEKTVNETTAGNVITNTISEALKQEVKRRLTKEEIAIEKQKLNDSRVYLLSLLPKKIENQEIMDVYVRNPMEQNGHIVYDVRGIDRDGIFEGKRRYNDFNALRNLFVLRYPGLIIPKIPPKKAIGNKEIQFLQERMYYLDRFLKKVCQVEYLYKSDEMLLFSRPMVEVSKAAERLARLTFAQKLERFIPIMDINLDAYTETEIMQLQAQLLNFTNFCRKVEPQLKMFKKQLKHFVKVKTSNITHNINFINELQLYEDLNLRAYVNETSKFILSSDETRDFQMSLRHTVDNLKNPYIDFYHWCKNELYDIRAIREALVQMDTLEQQKKRIISNNRNQQTDLNNIQSGKTSVTAIFKTNDVNTLSTRMDQNEKLIKDLSALIALITINLAEREVSLFKKEKALTYKRMIQQFSVLEKNNAQQMASCWRKLRETNVQLA